MIVRITKVSDNPNAFRGSSMVGELVYPISAGNGIHVRGEALDPQLRELGGMRLLQTSPVVEDLGGGLWRTLNSTYRVEEISDCVAAFCDHPECHELVKDAEGA